MRRVLVVVGTRPEAVKLAPVVRAARGVDDLETLVRWSGQHTGLLGPHADALGMLAPRGPAGGADRARLVSRVQAALSEVAPDAVVAQGDTDSVVAAAEVASVAGVPFVHLEAGLRSGSLEHPWPEEGNRLRIASLAKLHLAPTPRAASNLRAEGISAGSIVVTGNTVVDALHHTLGTLGEGPPSARMRRFASARRRILFTQHRGESVRAGALAVASAVAAVADAFADVQIVMPRHPNPALEASLRALGQHPQVVLLPPLTHPELVWLLRRCTFAITDSGGLQEEAPSLGVPVLVTRLATERPEAIERGWARLVGWDQEAIVRAASSWLTDEEALARARPWCNPYGDGRAAMRCVQALQWSVGLRDHGPSGWAGPAVARVGSAPAAQPTGGFTTRPSPAPVMSE